MLDNKKQESTTNFVGFWGINKIKQENKTEKKAIAKSKMTNKTHNQVKHSKKISPSFVLSSATRCS
jgi:hypothetical protein